MTSGISYQHVREAAPDASVLKLGMTYPLPLDLMKRFAAGVERCLAVEEGDPYLLEASLAAGIRAEGKPEMYRFGELNVERVRRILRRDTTPEPAPPAGKPPELCQGCPHRSVFAALRDLGCIVSGDIGCYTLGVMPPFEALDICLCMGASIGAGLGIRHVVPADQARRVVSVIGDSTFLHSGLTGIVEMVYNPPPTGHVVLILDNATTAMTGFQEHPGTGRALDHARAAKVSIEDMVRAAGVRNVHVIDPTADQKAFRELLRRRLAADELSVIIARRECLLAARAIREYERCNERQSD
jgi:indolepyruvate ferredoxin oxidoreductase alpha subunit